MQANPTSAKVHSARSRLGGDAGERIRKIRSRPGRILFVGEAVSLAHVSRPAVLARWAKAAGYDVAFACGPAYADVARGEGLTPVPLPTISPVHFYRRVAQGKFFYTAEELETYVRAEIDLLNETRPDLVVGDFRLSLGISAALTGTPLLSLSNAYWSPASPCRFPPPCAGGWAMLPPGLRQVIFACIRPLAFRIFAGPLNHVRRRFGLPALGDFREHYTAGRWCAYADLSGWVPTGPLPAGHFYLGPIAWQPLGLPALPLGELGRRRPLAYVSMGGSGPADVLPNVLHSLAKLNCDVVLSGINDRRASVFPGLRLRKAPLFDPSEVLERAVVTVCHGGSGTIYQSLAAGVPVLSLPSNPDQGLAARSVVAHGAGLVVEAERASPWRLNAALTALLNDDRYARGAEQVAGALRRHDSRDCWRRFLASALERALALGPAAGGAFPGDP